MTCPLCNGDTFLRRLQPHPGVKGCMVTVTKPCPKCKGKGKVGSGSVWISTGNASISKHGKGLDGGAL
jgi:DnaJ-class molecular chaperone